VFDPGFVQGVTVSEQLRTFGGTLFELDQHLQRLSRSLQIVGLTDIDLDSVRTQALAIASHNHSLLQPGDDLGLTIFVTPGCATSAPGGQHAGPTIGIYTTPLPFHRWSNCYTGGESLVVSSVRQSPGNCWPEELKCRSRMHYYLADQEARRKKPGARALLLDQSGFVAEASTASVLAWRQDEGFVAPPVEKVLPSISVRVIKRLAAELSLNFVHRDLTVEDMLTADEVLLSSTSPCLLPVLSIDQTTIGNGQPGPIFQQVLSAWNQLTNTDIAAQAVQFATR
jgi:branched-subunit amino acid aminotransferase/4-amino-4-deoxychorismate lyase